MNRNSARVLVVGGPPLESNYTFRNRQILAHNDDKRKKIMFVTGLEGLDEAAGHLDDALRVGEKGAYNRD